MVELFKLDLVVLGAAIGPALVVLPFLRFAMAMPARCTLEPVAPEELRSDQAKWFQRLDARMATLGFRPVATFRVSDLPSRNLNRAYTSGADPAVALATAVSNGKGETLQSASYLEFQTDFRDGTCIGTRSIRAPALLDELPGTTHFEHPRTKDPVALKARHDAHCEPHRIREAVHHRSEDFLAHFAESWRRQMELQVERGLLRRRTAQDLRPTLRLALRAALDFLSPSGRPLHPGPLVATALLGFVVPVLALSLLRGPEPGVLGGLVASASLLGGAAPWLVGAGVLALSALSLGALVDRNAHVWGFLLPYVAGRALEPAMEPSALFLLAAAGSSGLAILAAAMRNRRRDLA